MDFQDRKILEKTRFSLRYSVYMFIRNNIGLERVSVMLYDNPDLIHDIIHYLAGLYIQVIYRALHGLIPSLLEIG